MFYSDAETPWLNLIRVWALFRWFLLVLGWILGKKIQGRMFKGAHRTAQIVLKSLICRLNVIDEVMMDVENRCNSNIQPAGWFRDNLEINVWIQWRRKWDFKTKELTNFTLFAMKKNSLWRLCDFTAVTHGFLIILNIKQDHHSTSFC